MRDFDADNFIRPGYGNIDPIVQAWMTGSCISKMPVEAVIEGSCGTEAITGTCPKRSRQPARNGGLFFCPVPTSPIAKRA
jgi:hypothetical protein